MRSALPFLFLMILAGCGEAQSVGAADHRPDGLALAEVKAPAATPIALTSAAIGADGALDARQSAYGANLSPALAWTPSPGAAAYALIVEDPDAHGPKPFVHWLIWNIPATANGLAEGVPTAPRPVAPAGGAQGRNGMGGTGYAGPHPPPGTGRHRYHFQIFALDRALDLAPGADRDALVAAMTGHVLATGDLVGVSAAPAGS